MSIEPPGSLEPTPPHPGHDDPAGPSAAPAESAVTEPTRRVLGPAVLVGLIVLLGVTQGLSMIVVVLAIIVMIFLHELGHYVMARRAGMLVTEFFIGFGPRIWSFHKGETEYGIKAIPAGAYVKIVGMSSMEEVDPELESRTYRRAGFGDRLGVAVAGSAMHFIIAIVLLVVQFAFVGAPDGERWQVGAITPGSAAAIGGIQEGDEIVAIDGVPVDGFGGFRTMIGDAEPGRVVFDVVRAGESIEIPIDLSTRMKIVGTIGEDLDIVDNGQAVVVGGPREGGAAEAAGIVGGETLLAVDGTGIRSLSDVADAVEGTTGGSFTLTTSTDQGGTADREVRLGSDVATTQPAAFVGVGPRSVLVTQSLPGATVEAGSTFGEVVKASVVGIGRFLWPPNMLGFVTDAFSGGPGDPTDTPTPAEDTPSTVSETRPISIVGVAMLGSDISADGWSNLIIFLAQLNIFIGVFNLFPLLPFDGGHVVVACYEKLRELRRRTGERYLADVSRMIPVATGVVVVLVTIGLLAIFVDVTRGVDI